MSNFFQKGGVAEDNAVPTAHSGVRKGSLREGAPAKAGEGEIAYFKLSLTLTLTIYVNWSFILNVESSFHRYRGPPHPLADGISEGGLSQRRERHQTSVTNETPRSLVSVLQKRHRLFVQKEENVKRVLTFSEEG